MIKKQNGRQDGEFKRLWRLCEDFQKIRVNLDVERDAAVEQLNKVQVALGIETDSHEPFQFGSKIGSPNAQLKQK